MECFRQLAATANSIASCADFFLAQRVDQARRERIAAADAVHDLAYRNGG